jgi:hypothetical protein
MAYISRVDVRYGHGKVVLMAKRYRQGVGEERLTKKSIGKFGYVEKKSTFTVPNCSHLLKLTHNLTFPVNQLLFAFMYIHGVKETNKIKL